MNQGRLPDRNFQQALERWVSAEGVQKEVGFPGRGNSTWLKPPHLQKELWGSQAKFQEAGGGCVLGAGKTREVSWVRSPRSTQGPPHRRRDVISVPCHSVPMSAGMKETRLTKPQSRRLMKRPNTQGPKTPPLWCLHLHRPHLQPSSYSILPSKGRSQLPLPLAAGCI